MHFRACPFLVLLISIICFPATLEASPLHTIALTGQQPPGHGSEVSFGRQFSAPAINNAGHAAFHAVFVRSGQPQFEGKGVWKHIAGNTQHVASTGFQAPGLATGVHFDDWFLSPTQVNLNNAGDVAFYATIAGPGISDPSIVGTNARAFWSEINGELRLALRNNSRLTDRPVGRNDFTAFLRAFTWNDQGAIAISSSIDGLTPTGDSIEAQSIVRGNMQSVLAMTRDMAPGITGHAFEDFNRGSTSSRSVPVISPKGSVAFHATTFLNDSEEGIWLARNGAVEAVATTQMLAPGSVPDAPFFSFSIPSVNQYDAVAFGAVSGNSSSGGTGVWSTRTGTLESVIIRGQTLPGSSEFRFNRLENPSSFVVPINRAGRVAFPARLDAIATPLDEDENTAVLSDGFGPLKIVAREGQRAPGTPEGVVFGDLGNTLITINAIGQTAFFGTLRGEGVTETNDEGIWAQDAFGNLQLIARNGDLMEVYPGDFRTLRDVGAHFGSGGEDGRQRSFNDRGQFGFSASFTDRSLGVFISNAVYVPEPSSVVLFATAACCFAVVMSRSFRRSR